MQTCSRLHRIKRPVLAVAAQHMSPIAGTHTFCFVLKTSRIKRR